MKKLLLILIIFLLSGCTFKNKIVENKERKADEKRSIESINYENQIKEEEKNIELKKIENQFFSLQYPSNWKLDDKVMLPPFKSYEIYTILKSPETKLTGVLADGSGKVVESMESPYRFVCKVYSPEKFFGSGNTIPEDKKIKLLEAAKKNNLTAWNDILYKNKSSLGLDHWEISTIKGKDVIIKLTGNEKVFLGGSLEFLRNGFIIRIEFSDLPQQPIPEIVNTKIGLLNLIKEKSYYKIIESINIK